MSARGKGQWLGECGTRDCSTARALNFDALVNRYVCDDCATWLNQAYARLSDAYGERRGIVRHKGDDEA